MTKGILVLEGGDSAGKTTLARYLAERHAARVLHSTVRKDCWRWHLGALRLAARLAQTQLVVLDRHFLSELVYGCVFRDGPQYDVGARCFDRVLRRVGAVYVLCAPADQERQVARWEADRVAGKREHFDRVREVLATYADLRYGNLARPGDGYLDQLIRFGDFTLRDDVRVYDLDVHGRDLGAFTGKLLHQLKRVQRQVRPGVTCSGRATEGWLLVGERLSPRYPKDLLPPWPWCDHERNLSAATWLNRALHHLGVSEERLVFVNALDHPGDLEVLTASSRLKPIALGGVALDALTRVGRSNPQVWENLRSVPHPQWHRRFRHGEGPEGYAELLKEAMR